MLKLAFVIDPKNVTDVYDMDGTKYNHPEWLCRRFVLAYDNNPALQTGALVMEEVFDPGKVAAAIQAYPGACGTGGQPNVPGQAWVDGTGADWQVSSGGAKWVT